ncbi:pyridoxal phosphate-dependent transferase [Aspergillus similis]
MSSIFTKVPYTPQDAIFELTKQYNADPSLKKVNLGQGTYKDENGNPWILPSVNVAKKRIDGTDHEYLPILGLASFRTLATRLLFGEDAVVIKERRVASCQALSGTGALHTAGKILYRAAQTAGDTVPAIYITNPSWSNHRQVFESIGFPVQEYSYSTPDADGIDMDFLTQTLNQAPINSIFVFHASAHNPSGWDPTPAQWKSIGKIVKERHLFSIFDAAYLGLTSGDFDTDAFAIRYFVEELKVEVAVCLSFAKNLGLYGERIGLCAFVTSSPTTAVAVESTLAQLIRTEISNPPAFGARIVAAVLDDQTSRSEWANNLRTMSERIRGMREALYVRLMELATPGNWKRITHQKGMFCVLGLQLEEVLHLRSRVSIAGLNPGNVRYVAECIDKTVRNFRTKEVA